MEHTDHILIVDADGDTRYLLAQYLQKSGLHATAVADSHAMWQALEDTVFDMLILDRLLPGEGGPKLCRMLRATSDLPVVMLSVLEDTDDRSACLAAGADEVLGKPFSPRELLARIHALHGACGLRRAHVEGRHS